VWHTWNGREIYTEVWWENPEGIDHLEDICRDGRIILKCVLKKKEGTVWTLFTCSRYEAVVVPCRHSNELVGSVNCRIYFD
jgi:hypothetical protein